MSFQPSRAFPLRLHVSELFVQGAHVDCVKLRNFGHGAELCWGLDEAEEVIEHGPGEPLPQAETLEVRELLKH